MAPSPEYYLLDVAAIPDELYDEKTPVEEWLKRCETAGAEGFAAGSLAKISPIERHVELERLVGITLYMLANLMPFVMPILLILLWRGWLVAKLFLGYVLVLTLFEVVYRTLYPQKPLKGVREKQYYYTEHNIQKYCSTRFVWPKSIHNPKFEDKPLIFCMVPHGVAPLGTTAYPLFSKLFNRRLNHPTAAPIVLKLPLVGWSVKRLGYIAAKAKEMKDVLTKKEENVSVILDGVAGMFQQDSSVEKLWLKERKGICKISLQTGCPIIPVYGFGHTMLWSVIVDPFGILEKLSIYLNVSIVPFYGRWGWPIGPPRRSPVTVCFGEPVTCERVEEPTAEQISSHHAKMLDAFRDVFDKHKAAYGWETKSVVFV